MPFPLISIAVLGDHTLHLLGAMPVCLVTMGIILLPVFRGAYSDWIVLILQLGTYRNKERSPSTYTQLIPTATTNSG